MVRRFYTLVAAFAGMLLAALAGNTALADSPLFTTADGIPQSSGILLNDTIWVFHRFEATTPINLQTVGGNFESFNNGASKVFAAVIALSNASDVPDSMNLSTPDVLGSTLIDVTRTNETGQDFSAPLELSLPAGWYALAFGTNALGAPAGPAIDLAMQNFTTDLSPAQDPVSLFQATDPDHPNETIVQIAQSRFFATGDPVPEPLLSLAWFAALVLGIGRRGASRRQCANS